MTMMAAKCEHQNGNGAQKMFTLLKLGVGLDHMYTKGWNFFAPAV